jgi:hypothetical protein
VSETLLYNLGSGGTAAKASLTPAPGHAVQVGHFEFFFGESGSLADAAVVDTDTMTLLPGSAEDWLQDAHNFTADLGATADDIRAALTVHAAETASHDSNAVTAQAESHLAALGETKVLALDVAAVFANAADTPHSIDLDALLAGVNPILHPTLDAIHPAIA